MKPQPNDLISLLDFSSEQITEMLSVATQVKAQRLTQEPQLLARRTGVLIFEKPSLRTRLTFETAIHELGGHAVNLESSSVQMGKRESVDDVARNLERWVHLVIARTYLHETVIELARHSSIPVINALTDRFHPCQALAFGQSLQEARGQKPGQHVVFVGDGNNVCNSLMVLCAKLGHHFTLVCPSGYEAPRELAQTCDDIARKRNATVQITHDVRAAVANASVIYTDVWASMGQEAEQQKRARDFAGFQVNDELISLAPDDVLVSHCLPAHRGEEITSSVLDSPRSIAFEEAENRLHVQKAVIIKLLTQDVQ
jgi:ornithine carbamoyltransferase